MKRLIAGPRAVQEALSGRADRIHVIYYEHEVSRSARPVLEQAAAKRVRAEARDRDALDALAQGLRHQGLLAITGDYPYVSLPELLAKCGDAPLIVALDQIQDPHNLGAIIRSAVAFGAAGVITLKDRAAPVTPVVVRASAGATEQGLIVRVTNLSRTLMQLREQDMQIIGLAGEGDTDLGDLPENNSGQVLVIGSEGSGLRPLVKKQCDYLTRIPMPGPIASLNAAVAAGIAIHACHKRQQQRTSTT